MNICRLCLLNVDIHMRIFSNYDRNKNVENIIEKHIGEVSESDPLPKQVCLECWTKLSTFHDFYQNVQTAQANYLQELVKQEQEKNFVDVLEPIHLDVPIEGEDALPNDFQIEEPIKIEYDSCKIGSPLIFSCDVSESLNSDPDVLKEDILNIAAPEKSEEKQSGSDEEYYNKIDEALATKKKYVYKKEFICDICQKIVSSKQKMLEHLSRHVNYKCEICSERCENRRALEIHTKYRHFKDAAEESKKQLDIIDKIALKIPNEREIERVLTNYCDNACDQCGEDLEASFEETQEHCRHKHGLDGYMKCCEIKMKTMENVNGHVLSHLHSKHFKCKLCGKFGKDIEKFRTHISKHLNEMEKCPHVCLVCGRGFTKINLLEAHNKYDHGIDESTSTKTLADFFTMRCDLCCDTSFSSFQDAKEHYTKSHGVVGYLVCCGKKFVKAKTVHDHFQLHINPEYHKCKFCGKCFNQKFAYSAHVSKHKALEDKRYTCSECDKAFYSNSYLKLHMKTHDKSTKKMIPCPHCHKRYTTQRSLETHIMFIHNNDGESKGVVCEICGRQFVSRASVVNHIHTFEFEFEFIDQQRKLLSKKAPVERSQCTMCSASFINKYRLKKHVESIHLGTPQKCSLCDKVAPNESALTCHMRSVHVAQRFQCHLCPKTFKAAVALKDHIATHTREKLYKCSFCPEAFIWRPNMYSHQKKAHPEEWQVLKGKDRKCSKYL